MNSTLQCSDCWLGVLALQLNNPLGYDDGLASNLASLSSSFNATGYSFTSPTAYALNTTVTTASPTATIAPTCTGVYTVQPTDNCNSVAKALNVSTYSLLQINNLDLYCQNFAITVNTTLCIPPQCTTYTWKASDTCDSVVSRYSDMTLPQSLAWNPNFNSVCLNSPSFIGYEVCVSPPGGYLNHTANTASATTGAGATSVTPAPTNAIDGSNHNCSQWYTVVEGDTCALVSLAQSISLADFYFLNPEINQNCTNLALGESYCVKPVGSITTYPNYTVTRVLPITVPPATFLSVNTAIPTKTNDPGYIYTPPPLLPTARCVDLASDYEVTMSELLAWNSWITRDCDTALYANLNESATRAFCIGTSNATAAPTTLSETTTQTTASLGPTQTGIVSGCQKFHTVQSGDTCASLESKYGITAAQFYQWNPSIGSTCTNLWLGYAYCVERSASSTTTTGPSAPTQTGIAANCNKHYIVVSGDSCAKVEAAYGITFAQLYEWNPAIGSDCQTLVIGYAVCVRVSP